MITELVVMKTDNSFVVASRMDDATVKVMTFAMIDDAMKYLTIESSNLLAPSEKFKLVTSNEREM